MSSVKVITALASEPPKFAIHSTNNTSNAPPLNDFLPNNKYPDPADNSKVNPQKDNHSSTKDNPNNDNAKDNSNKIDNPSIVLGKSSTNSGTSVKISPKFFLALSGAVSSSSGQGQSQQENSPKYVTHPELKNVVGQIGDAIKLSAETCLSAVNNSIEVCNKSAEFLNKNINNRIDNLSEEMVDRVSGPVAEKLKALITTPTAPIIIKDVNDIIVSQTNDKMHKLFPEILETIVKYKRKNIRLVGPRGSTKTTMAQKIAELLKLPFSAINCTAGMSESWIIGRSKLDGDYIPSSFVKLFEEGGVFLLDESDAADGNVLLLLNTALEQGILSIPGRPENPIAKRHPDFICIACANTWGRGATLDYAGRMPQDAAFLDRFKMGVFYVDYDTSLEVAILGHINHKLLDELWRLRAMAAAKRIRNSITTRDIAVAAHFSLYGMDDKKILARLFVDWSEEDMNKLGLATTI